MKLLCKTSFAPSPKGGGPGRNLRIVSESRSLFCYV